MLGPGFFRLPAASAPGTVFWLSSFFWSSLSGQILATSRGCDPRVPWFLARSFAKPPKQVQTVCECILIMKGYKELNWKTAKGVMSDPNFLRSLMEIDFDSITQSQVKNIKGECSHVWESPGWISVWHLRLWDRDGGQGGLSWAGPPLLVRWYGMEQATDGHQRKTAAP